MVCMDWEEKAVLLVCILRINCTEISFLWLKPGPLLSVPRKRNSGIRPSISRLRRREATSVAATFR